ncbi:MAG TPA: hypothetical protein VFV41_08445 [Streptosporangiaceae bacterium]|nr:hypothetical protein [Streptosporangiaceae bacterium]
MQYRIAVRTVPARWPRSRRRRVSVSFGGLASVRAPCPAALKSSG